MAASEKHYGDRRITDLKAKEASLNDEVRPARKHASLCQATARVVRGPCEGHARAGLHSVLGLQIIE